MKFTQSLVAIAALSTLSFAGGDINPVTVFEQEPVVDVVVEPIPEPEYVAPIQEQEYVAPVQEQEYVAPTPTPTPTPTPVEPPKEVVPPVAAAPLGLYLAGGLTGIAASYPHDDMPNLFSEEKNQDRQLGFTGRLGYDFMDYLGAELRATYGFAKADYSKYKQVGAYLKPNYDITEALNLYGLIGASKSNHAGIAATETGLSYGVGLDYKLSNSISIFTDVLNYMDKDDIPESWGLTVGAAYQF